MGIEIRGLGKLNSQLKKIPSAIQKAGKSATEELVEETKSRAVSKLQSSVKHGSGELAGTVQDEVVLNDHGDAIGRVWTDKREGMYREFGTGPVGEASEKDLPDGVTPVYTQERWFIPADAVAVDLEAVYGIPRITVEGKDYFMTRGQPARPWLYPSLKEVLEFAPEVYQEHVQKGLKNL